MIYVPSTKSSIRDFSAQTLYMYVTWKGKGISRKVAEDAVRTLAVRAIHPTGPQPKPLQLYLTLLA